MRTAFLDAFSGLSGDMLVAAMLDAGADATRMQAALGALALSGYKITIGRRSLSGISAVKFDVEVLEDQPERRLGEIREIIERSSLPPAVKQNAIKIFALLADAEAKVHNTTADHVHFHEVGAVDSIIDIVGAAWCVNELGIDRMLVSPMPSGTGFVKSRHGTIPIPVAIRRTAPRTKHQTAATRAASHRGLPWARARIAK